MKKPLAIDGFCGLGGWTKGLLAEGWQVIGFDIERHVYGDQRYPSEAQLVLQDVRTLHGSQFKDAQLLTFSPPCQGYSYRAMPWKRAKALSPPDDELFFTCFRLQAEASAAAGRHIPMVVENVCGAQRWVGRAAWHYGSYYLWGDVPALMPATFHRKGGVPIGPPSGNGGSTSWFGTSRADPRDIRKNKDGEWTRFGLPDEGIKQGGEWWHDPNSITRRTSSRFLARKAASAMIAEIPFELACYIARVFKPEIAEEKVG